MEVVFRVFLLGALMTCRYIKVIVLEASCWQTLKECYWNAFGIRWQKFQYEWMDVWTVVRYDGSMRTLTTHQVVSERVLIKCIFHHSATKRERFKQRHKSSCRSNYIDTIDNKINPSMKLAEEFKKLLHIGGTTPGRVLVLDGSDAVGHRVVERLIDAEYTDNLRVGVRTLKQGGNAGGAELVLFVWEDESTYATAL